jgi:hypothetical protein
MFHNINLFLSNFLHHNHTSSRGQGLLQMSCNQRSEAAAPFYTLSTSPDWALGGAGSCSFCYNFDTAPQDTCDVLAEVSRLCMLVIEGVLICSMVSVFAILLNMMTAKWNKCIQWPWRFVLFRLVPIPIQHNCSYYLIRGWKNKANKVRHKYFTMQ